MVSVKRNIIANYLGSGWSALMGLAFIPFYMRLMGAEAYGIVGVFVSLQAMLAVLDLGLSQTLNREMARLSVNGNNSTLMADTARTLEIIYWAVAVLLVIAITLLSNFIAYRWLNPVQLSRGELTEALWVIAFVLGLRWPVALYMGGLNGLQRQILVNVLLGIFATLQGAGALAVLYLYEPTVRAFFLWQALVAILQVTAFRVALWHSLDSPKSGAFRKEALMRIWRFAAGISGISILSTVLTQLDKVILSKMLSLSEFGYYTFAATVAAVVYRFIGPVFMAYYPRLTELVCREDTVEVSRTYHHGSQIMSVAVLPLTLTLAFFSKEILEIWSSSAEIVTHTYLIVSLLVVGNALNGLMHLPYALQLANGWTRLAFYSNMVAVLVLVPIITISVTYWGPVGAAGAWILLNSGYLLISVQVMHRRLLTTEKWRWYSYDVGMPLLIVLLIVGVGRVLIDSNVKGVLEFTSLFMILFLAIAGAAGSFVLNRQMLSRQFHRPL